MMLLASRLKTYSNPAGRHLGLLLENLFQLVTARLNTYSSCKHGVMKSCKSSAMKQKIWWNSTKSDAILACMLLFWLGRVVCMKGRSQPAQNTSSPPSVQHSKTVSASSLHKVSNTFDQ